MLCNRVREQTTAACINMSEAQRGKAEWKGQVTEECIQYEPNCLPFQSQKTKQHIVKRHIHVWLKQKTKQTYEANELIINTKSRRLVTWGFRDTISRELLRRW